MFSVNHPSHNHCRLLMGDVLPRETENTVYRYLIAISKLRLGILTAIQYKTKGVRTFGSTAAEIVCREATLKYTK